jgi:chromosome segregation protein
MKIKKLEISGFKSFVDKTIIHFDADVMAIVGPNGCGKSNIVDAIRWCMGEQSAKHLRGKSMEDVIFNGSETRPPHDFAEVTLTFDNDDGGADLPPEYKDYAEIAVTRRLHRNGDSEYLINKTPVRLRDITDLFLGTGVGTKAYSIVEQGRIGLIVSAKPEDRRLLIEEAAGITKFKSKKKQAERKMELTQQNLLRVGDIVAEIERNLGSLKRQAAKAERYLAYRNELEDLQLYDASHKWLELTGWIQLERGEVERLGAEAEGARSALAAREAELEAARLQAHGAEEALERANNASFAAENEVRTEEAAIERAKDKLQAIRQREEQAEGEAKDIAAQSAELGRERDAMTTLVEGLQHEDALHAESVAASEATLAELTAEQEAADRAVTEMRATQAKAEAEIAAAEAKLTGFDRRREEMRARHEKMQNDRESLEGTRIDHEARVQSLMIEVEELRAGKVVTAEERQRIEARLAELRHEILGSERALEEAKSEHSRKRSRLHALTEVHARLEGVGAGVKALMSTKDDALVGLVADRIEAPHELTGALAGLLGHRLQDVVVRDVERGVALLADLESAHKGRATIVPAHPRYVAGTSASLPDDEGVVCRLADRLRFEPEDEPLVHALVGDAIVARDVKSALRIRDALGSSATSSNLAVVTLGGTVFHPDGSISGGTGEELAAGMLETKREIRELGEEVSRLESIVSERLAAHQALRQAIAETQGALERARHQAHERELALVTAEKDLASHQKQLETIAQRLTALAGEIEEMSRFLAEADHERAQAERFLDEARATREEVLGKVADAESLAASWRTQVEAQRQVVMEKKVSLAKTREKLFASQGAMLRLTRSIEELDDRRRRLEDEIAQGARIYGETAALLVQHKEKLQLALDGARAAQDALAEARTVFEAFRANLAEREAELKELRARAEEAREALTTHEMALRERELAMNHLLDGVREKFRGTELPRIIGDYHLRPPPDEETHARIQELTSLIDRMGGVNLDAMREHEEAEKRYAFYSEQKADLEKALDDLAKAIAQMNRESKRLFMETFEKVNERFQEIFPKMFRGGRASLRLTDPEDMLETGIEILAQPPGKKLSSIELMSGGEKALTAVSLIFAIFQIKPSPFCILDEVDAPLDEANVGRYNDMIREMTEKSQFILITHIKKTMQLADVLYGVTMQEAGVSRLVGVKMNDAMGDTKKTTRSTGDLDTERQAAVA